MIPKGKTLTIVLIAVIAAIALAGRTYRLDTRPMHTDEAVHAVKFIELLDHGTYRYDPHEYHGPTLYYFTLPVAWLRGQTTGLELDEVTLRLVCVLASGLFFIPLFFMAKHVEGYGAVLAAIAVAASPIIVYLSRYFIHEVFLVAFFFMFLVFAWRYALDKTWGWAVATGVSFGLALATKETIALSIIAVVVAIGAVFMTEPEWRKNWRKWVDWKHIGIALGATSVVVLVFYSSFFTHPRGILDFCKTYLFYLDRAGGQGHEKPWYYYLRLLFFYRNGYGFTGTEAYVLVAATVAGTCSFLKPFKNRAARTFVKFLFVYSVALMVIYSCIPYKMPWLALNWMQPMTVLAGIGIAWLLGIKSLPLRAVTILFSLTAAYHMGYQIYRENGRFQCDPRNPYVYSHTCADLLSIPKMINELGALHPAGKRMPVQVICDEYWPLPWYLRDFAHVGYWHTPPDGPLFQTIITTPAIAKEMGARLDGYRQSTFWLRRGVSLLVYVRKDLWDEFIEERSKRHGN